MLYFSYVGACSYRKTGIHFSGTCAGPLLALVLATVACAPVRADPVADFYAGKTIQVLIGFSPGGGYDLYGRLIARHMGRHIPGNPKLVPQNMPGAGSLKAVNYLYGVAPKDGTALAHFAPGVLFEPLLGHPEGAQFDATKFNWLGSASREASVCAFIAGAGVKSWADMRRKPTIIGASGGGAESDVFPTVLRNMFHLPLKIVTGYPGGTEITLAMERHEVDGRCGWSWTSLLSRSKALLDSHQLDVVLQIALEKTKDLPDVPLIVDVADNAEQKAALKLIVARQSIARPFAAPPGIPAERARALQEAFTATLADPEFIADAKGQSLDIEAVQGREVETLIREVYASSPQAVALATAAMRETKE
jgi:tripartite-type tricarboxylate transporter receptor subunit TctC